MGSAAFTPPLPWVIQQTPSSSRWELSGRAGSSLPWTQGVPDTPKSGALPGASIPLPAHCALGQHGEVAPSPRASVLTSTGQQLGFGPARSRGRIKTQKANEAFCRHDGCRSSTKKKKTSQKSSAELQAAGIRPPHSETLRFEIQKLQTEKGPSPCEPGSSHQARGWPRGPACPCHHSPCARCPPPLGLEKLL